MSDKNCTFIGEFLVDKKILDCNYIDIIFHGLDTICDVYLNETLLACVNDMHCAYTYDVKSSLVEGKNIVRLDFKSPTKYFAEKNRRNFLYTNMDTIPGAAHLRKALYMSGWDWGPTLPDMGIFRPVEIRAYNTDIIEDVLVIQHHEENEVKLEISVATKYQSNADLYIISVKDDVISNIVNDIEFSTGLWVHTSGSVPVDVLKQKFDKCGVFYPLQQYLHALNL